MIDGGIIVMILGSLIMFAKPAHSLLVQQRIRSAATGMVLRSAYPLPTPTPPLAALVANAEAALARDALLRGVRCVGEAYDQA